MATGNDREQRLSAALRENLKRRKAQARERTEEKSADGDSAPQSDATAGAKRDE